MTSNPLRIIDGSTRRTGKVTVEMLYELADKGNAMDWVRQSRKPYFVDRKANGDGTITHFLDRQA